jgi:hypothetical protein
MVRGAINPGVAFGQTLQVVDAGPACSNLQR